MPFLTEAIPTSQTAVKQQQDGILQLVHDAAVPSLEPGTVLVHVKAVALNPTDYKLPANFPTSGATAGTDFSGVVVATCPSSIVQVGDRVCGSVFGSNPADLETGAFAQYVKVDADLLARVPESMTWEEAAAIGGVGHSTVALSLWTTCIGLEGTIDKPVDKALDKEARHVLVYGASTATGTMALQILKACGYLPIAVCSPQNFGLVRRYGAVATFDYALRSCGQDIRAYTHDELWLALDCISDARSTEVCFQSLGRAGGRYVHLELLDQEAREIASKRKAVKVEFLMQYEAFGKAIKLPGEYSIDAKPERRDFAVAWYKTLEGLLQQGSIVPHPIQRLDGGWDAIFAGLQDLKSGKVSGKKLVIALGT